MTAWPLPKVTFRRRAANVRVVAPAWRFWLRISTRPDVPLTRHTLTSPVGRMRRRTVVGAARRWRLRLRLLLAVVVAVAGAVAPAPPPGPPPPGGPPSFPPPHNAPPPAAAPTGRATKG